MQMMRILFTLLNAVNAVQAVYLSTLVGPMQTIPGPPTMGLSQMMSIDLDDGSTTTSYGTIGAPGGYQSTCQISSLGTEAPITTGQIDSNLYTICSTTTPDGSTLNALASGSLLGSQTYGILGTTAAFDTAVVQRLTTDNGTNFYILTRAEPGNSTIWWIRQGSDLSVIHNGTEDGYVIQSIQITQGALMAIGNRLQSPTAKQVLWWGGRGLPQGPQPPQPYPGLLASNGNGFQHFTFSDPTTLWLLSSSGAVGGSSMLIMYIYNRQTLAWTIGGYYMFNATQPAPNQLYMGGRPPITKFHGVTPNALVEYTLPPAGGGSSGTSSTIASRVLLSAERGKMFRGLAVSQWTAPPSPSPSSVPSLSPSSTVTSSMSMSVTATGAAVSHAPTATETGSASATASATSTNIYYATFPGTLSTSPTQSSHVSSTPNPSASPSASAKSTHSVGYSESNTPSPTPTPSQTASPTATLSPGASPSTTSTASESATATTTPTFVNNTGAAIAASTDPDYGLKVGFGVAVPLLIVGASGFVLFSLFKSGKLFTMFKSKPNYMRHGYGGKAPRAPMAKHPIMSHNPLASQTLQMNINTKALESMRSGHFSMRALDLNNQVLQPEKPQTIVKTRVSFPQMQASQRSLGTSV